MIHLNEPLFLCWRGAVFPSLRYEKPKNKQKEKNTKKQQLPKISASDLPFPPQFIFPGGGSQNNGAPSRPLTLREWIQALGW